jgi:hypothetical protein
VLEPDSVTRVTPARAGTPGRDLGPSALQILMTEHWSLLAARGLVSLARFFAWAYRSIERYRDDLDVPFPSPPRGNG